ncbi:MAG: hypothetical protein U9Q15_01635 [Patescibacteria group bacterium]|nr:hypothetical protein [Patescibacteria group bacterium]
MFSRTTSSTLASLIISALVLPLLSYWKDIELVSAYTDSSISEETDNSLIYVFIDADTKEALSQSLEIGNKFYSFLESLQDAGKDTYTGLQGIYNTLDSQIAYGGDLLAH